MKYESFSASRLHVFSKATNSEILKFMKCSAPHTCELDAVPILLLLDCAEVVAPYVTESINVSLSTGTVPSSHKSAILRPLLKKKKQDWVTISISQTRFKYLNSRGKSFYVNRGGQ